ncbi:hypothetical protein P2H44_09780 [Albimonas sp. CAU 1670]|nr:hypothetical protein [Albimonas sp. CAU 1670]MDF2232843.1 hypothetical protein [Albimonas sp. CAU 1670]
MSVVFRYLLYLVLLAAAGFAVYAAIADLPAPVREIAVPAPPPNG